MRHKPFPGSPDDMMNTIAALRARVAKLEAGGEPNSYEARMDAYGKKIDELMARNAKLEAVLLENYDQINALRAYVAKLEAVLRKVRILVSDEELRNYGILRDVNDVLKDKNAPQ